MNEYLSNSQAAYIENRSITDIIWIGIAKILLYKEQKVKATGLAMSSAFDTVDREEMLKVLEGM